MRLPSLSKNSSLPTRIAKPFGYAGSQLPRILTRETVTSSGNFTSTHGLLFFVVVSFLLENHDVSTLPSTSFSTGQPPQKVLQLSWRLSRCFLMRVLALSSFFSWA